MQPRGCFRLVPHRDPFRIAARAAALLLIASAVLAHAGAQAAPFIYEASISGFSGTDPDADGYFDSFQFTLAVDANAGTSDFFDVRAVVWCTTTGDCFFLGPWTIAGNGADPVTLQLRSQSFSLRRPEPLRFRVELWDAAFGTMHDATENVAGAPFNADGPACSASIRSAAIANLAATDADADGFAEAFSLDILVDADASVGCTMSVAAEVTCTATGQSWRLDAWQIAGAAADPRALHLTHAGLAPAAAREFAFSAALCDPAFTTLLDEEPVAGTVRAEPAPCTQLTIRRAAIDAIRSAVDTDLDGYYNQYEIDIGVDADTPGCAAAVVLKVSCPAIAKQWYSPVAAVSGAGPADTITLPLNYGEFPLTTETDLTFTAQLLDASRTQALTPEAPVAGSLKAEAPTPVPNGVVCGTILYQQPDGTCRPVRYGFAEIRIPSRAADDAVTDVNGFYTKRLSRVETFPPNLFVRALAKSTPGGLPLRTSDVAVVKPPGGSQVYCFDSPQRPSYPGSVLRVDIVIPAAQAAPFAIFDSLIEGYLGSHSYMGIYPPVVQVAWPGTDTRYDAGTIHIAPGDAWDRDVILHQYGHHVASSAGFLTAPCGQYTWDADLRGWGRQRTADEAARLAFREGWAEFFALAVQQPAGGAVFDDLEDKAVSHDLEKCTSRRRTPGEFYQSMVACSLWDILDAHEDLADDRDSLSKPLSDIWSVLATDKPATMADFHAAWLARRGCKVELTRILRDHGMSFLPPGCTVRVASNRPQQFVLSEQQSGSWAGTAPCVYTGMPAGSYTISWTTDCPEPPNIAQQAAAGASIGFAWSSPGDCQPPAPPAPPIVLKATATTIAFSADPSGNGDSTLFALVCCGSEPLDASFDQRWIDACGRPSPQPVWLPAAAWRDIPIAGLQSGTAYQVAASAKNAFGEAGPSFGAEARTTIAGDVNGDCRVNILDLIAIRSRLNCSICSCAGAAAADLNCDGVCNLLDLITCRNNINASCAGAR